MNHFKFTAQAPSLDTQNVRKKYNQIALVSFDSLGIHVHVNGGSSSIYDKSPRAS